MLDKIITAQGFRDNSQKNNTITKTHIAEVTTNYARKNAANNSGNEMTGMLMKQNQQTHSIGEITPAANPSTTNGNSNMRLWAVIQQLQ